MGGRATEGAHRRDGRARPDDPTAQGRVLTMTTAAAVLVVGSATAAVGRPSPPPRFAGADHRVAVESATLPTRPDKTDWEKIQAAARTHTIGLERHRTSHFRAYAGALAPSELATIHRLAAGPYRRALRYLYGSLLDLRDAQPGENWAPLCRLVATEPSIHARAPRGSKQKRT
jgi:hypothetical protein